MKDYLTMPDETRQPLRDEFGRVLYEGIAVGGPLQGKTIRSDLAVYRAMVPRSRDRNVVSAWLVGDFETFTYWLHQHIDHGTIEYEWHCQLSQDQREQQEGSESSLPGKDRLMGNE